MSLTVRCKCVFDAVQYTGDNFKEVKKFCKEYSFPIEERSEDDKYLVLYKFPGVQKVLEGCFLVSTLSDVSLVNNISVYDETTFLKFFEEV